MPYIGTQPNDVKKNTGLYTPSEILQLTKDGSWGGSLELIEEQVITSTTSAVDFTDLKNYDVHFLTLNGMQPTSDNDFGVIQFSNDGGSTFESSNYQYANQSIEADGSTVESKSTTATSLITTCLAGNATNEKANGYIYLYNLLDSSKYSFQTWQSISINNEQIFQMRFGSGVYSVAETINAIRLLSNAGTNFSATASLYGIAES